MNKLVMVLLVLFASAVWAEALEVEPGTGMLGWSNLNGDSDLTTLTNTGYTTFGNNNAFICGYTTVVKFSLASFHSNTVNSATLSLWRYCATSGVYVQLQHTTQQTAGATVTHADVADLTFENVGSAEDFTVTSNQFDWDVTSYVNADLAAGYDYITFLVKAVDSNGNPVGANMYGNICSKDVYAPYEPKITAKLTPLVLLDTNGLHADIYHMSTSEPSTMVEYATDTLKSAFVAATGNLPDIDPNISPVTLMEGYVNQYGGSALVTTDSYLCVGNNNQYNCSYRTILKFPLNGTYDVKQAALKVWRWWGGGVGTGSTGYPGVYMRLQHATTDIGGTVVWADATSSNFENVGATVLVTNDGNALQTWDVKTFINADRVADFNYCSFRLIAVDSNSNPIDSGSSWANYGAIFDSLEWDSDYSPRIVVIEDGDIPIRIGVSDQFESGIDSNSSQAYEIRRNNDAIELVGNSEPAVLWAVLDFCENVLNISWPVANDSNILEGEEQTSIVVDSNSFIFGVQTPGFECRGWILGENTNGYGYENKIDNWMSHNKQNATTVAYPYLADGNDSLNPKDKLLERGISADTTMHSFYWLVPVSLFDTHPEYFPLIDGVRVPSTGGTGPQLCISNAAVQQMMIDQAKAAFAAHPEISTFGIVPNDGVGQWCECDACKAMDGNQADTGVYSNRLISLCNTIAAATHSEYPNRYIGTLAYSDFSQAPTIDVNDNVFITYCINNNLMKQLKDANDATNTAIMSNLNAWLARVKNISLYEYYWFSGSDFCPSPFTRILCGDLADLEQRGIKGISVQTRSVRWHNMRLLNYAFAQMTWNPSLDFDSILSDYCSKMYGLAASNMQLYHLLYESTIRDNVSVLDSITGAGEQHIPVAFTDSEITTLRGYLNDANDIVNADGTQIQIDAVKHEIEEFDQFCRLRVDPCSIPNIGANVIVNPGAESVDSNWNTHSFCTDYSFTIDSSEKHSGSNSFKIECTGSPCENRTACARWYQLSAPVVPGNKYAMSFWVKASENAFGNIVVWAGPDAVEVHFDNTDGQWAHIICPEIVATNSVLDIYLQSCGSGTVYFDDIFVACLGLAGSPSPANGATGVSVTTDLSWTVGSGATSHDVYFGVTLADVNDANHSSSQFKGNQAGLTYDLGTLSGGTTYYWRIDEIASSGTTKGVVWSFTTLMPTFVAAGAVTSGTGTITPTLPAGIATGDILLLFLETSNQAITIPTLNGGTWTAVTNSPQYCGTAAGTTGVRLTVFWSRYNGTQGAPTTSDSGDHQTGRMIAIRGAAASGDPWDVTAGSVEATSDTSGSIPGATTTVANTLIVTAIATSLPDESSTAKFSAWTNANLTSITERIDNSVTAGNGGGLGIATGIKATAGAYGNTTVTLVSSAYKSMMSIAIKP